jgi:hypothetical protein
VRHGFGAGGVGVRHGVERVVDDAIGLRPAAHDGNIGLADLLASELLGKRGGGRLVEREGQRSRGALVEAMHGKDVPAELVSQHLHGEARLVPVDERAVHQQAGRLVDDDDRVVLVKDGQLVGGGRCRPVHHGISLPSQA